MLSQLTYCTVLKHSTTDNPDNCTVCRVRRFFSDEKLTPKFFGLFILISTVKSIFCCCIKINHEADTMYKGTQQEENTKNLTCTLHQCITPNIYGKKANNHPIYNIQFSIILGNYCTHVLFNIAPSLLQ